MTTRRDIILGGAAALAVPFIGKCSPVMSSLGAEQSGILSSEGGMPTASDYVQDGLVAMWDGIENAGYGIHDDSSLIWRDIVGGLDVQFSSGVPVWGVNEWDGNSGGYWYSEISDDIKTILEQGDFTVECIIGSVGILTNEKGIFHIGGNNSNSPISMKYNQGSNKAFNQIVRGVSKGVTNYGGGESSYSISIHGSTARYYKNGIPQGTFTVPEQFTINDNRIFLGRYNVSYTLTLRGGLHAVRIYSYALTADEILYNHKIDIERF